MWKKTKEMKWKTAKLLWGDLFYDIAGAVLFAAGVYTFAGNADFAPGGITGISLLLNHVFGIPVGTLTLFINLPLIVISYRTLGKRFLLKTAKSMVITTFFLDVVFPVFPMYEGQRMMAALCSGALMGAGMVMFYMRGSSSGGTDLLPERAGRASRQYRRCDHGHGFLGHVGGRGAPGGSGRDRAE